MLRLMSALLVLTSAVVLGQRPFFAGSRPIGYPDTPNRTTTTPDSLGDRFGEGTTERLPIEANGDRDLIDRLSKLPLDKQPFWFINWQALEEHRKKPQTYPQRPNVFIDNTSNQAFSNNRGIPQGFITNRGVPTTQRFSSNTGNANPHIFINEGIPSNQVIPSHQGFVNQEIPINQVFYSQEIPSNQRFSNNNGFANSNNGFSNTNNGFSNPNPGFSNANGFTNTNPGLINPGNVKGISNPNLVVSTTNSGFTNPNSGLSNSNSGLPNSNSGLPNSNPGVVNINNRFSSAGAAFSSSAVSNRFGDVPTTTNSNNYHYNWNNSYQHASYYTNSYNSSFYVPHKTYPVKGYQ